MKREMNQHKNEVPGQADNIKQEELKIDELNDEAQVYDQDRDIDKMTESFSEDDNASEPKNELDELQKKYNELNDSYLRLTAEFDNFRKRTIKEKADIIKSGGERVLMGIVTLVDDFERALVSMHESEDKKAMLEGIDLIYSKFISFLKQNGVEEIEAVGQPFDADTFEAVTTIPAQDESQKGTVVDCIQKGYKLNDKIIRYPKVVVGE